MEENTVPLLSRFGGDFVWKPGEVHYKGGENRIIRVDRAINYANLLCKVHQTCKSPDVNSIKSTPTTTDVGAASCHPPKSILPAPPPWSIFPAG
ncbi:hypothetical protein ACLOJK_027576 [Asimina triloba]